MNSDSSSIIVLVQSTAGVSVRLASSDGFSQISGVPGPDSVASVCPGILRNNKNWVFILLILR